jgi:phospholipid transport system substrate-binding protein
MHKSHAFHRAYRAAAKIHIIAEGRLSLELRHLYVALGQGDFEVSMSSSQRAVSAGRRAILGLASAGLITGALGRTTAWAAGTGAGSVEPIQSLDAALLEAMKMARSTTFEQRFKTIALAVDHAFDLDTILINSVGARWSTLSPDEQALLQVAFRRYTVANYVANFDSYNGQTFRINPDVHAIGNGDQIVATEIVPTNGSLTKLSYVMRNSPMGWRAVDVLADGTISRVAVQRSDFRSLISSGGSNALMSRLNRKVVDLAGGNIA